MSELCFLGNEVLSFFEAPEFFYNYKGLEREDLSHELRLSDALNNALWSSGSNF